MLPARHRHAPATAIATERAIAAQTRCTAAIARVPKAGVGRIAPYRHAPAIAAKRRHVSAVRPRHGASASTACVAAARGSTGRIVSSATAANRADMALATWQAANACARWAGPGRAVTWRLARSDASMARAESALVAAETTSAAVKRVGAARPAMSAAASWVAKRTACAPRMARASALRATMDPRARAPLARRSTRARARSRRVPPPRPWAAAATASAWRGCAPAIPDGGVPSVSTGGAPPTAPPTACA